MLQEDTSRWPMVICQQPNQIPAGAVKVVREEIIRHLGSPINVLFPAFSEEFPKCVAALNKYWGVPKLVVKPVALNWIASIALEGQGPYNIQVALRTVASEVDGPEFDEYKAMLPMAWRELYRWFDSFGITTYPFDGHWTNTPFSHYARLDLEQYSQRIDVKKSRADAFQKRMDSSKLRCWLLTDAGDSLWLDEQRCDQKVYHLRGADFEQVTVLENSAQILDSYLAHVVSGGAPHDFDFRSRNE